MASNVAIICFMLLLTSSVSYGAIAISQGAVAATGTGVGLFEPIEFQPIEFEPIKPLVFKPLKFPDISSIKPGAGGSISAISVQSSSVVDGQGIPISQNVVKVNDNGVISEYYS